ncbi:cytochrome aa3 quinol oxidase subunit IV [Aquisalibacillus elongatus]|uniref:Quinol oxidase subunit 4 n=1 Tax=Aquisalibacillus elongatus TaxID=485577 RepID=A0A3N5C9F4_9BACI|nr:cytochrome aa3 quinol oxidase subunit IV [Aquisalibacillus elongatus]RPF53261.1 cytochrome aa3 quinol oxidase subunit 4 [Aquisalibacillus elongatus]
MSNQVKKVPTQHIVGFVLSLVLTALAVWTALGSDLSTAWIITIIMLLAVIQAGIQLVMFMHIVEPESQNGHVPWNMIFHGFVTAAIVVVGSLFVMVYGF